MSLYPLLLLSILTAWGTYDAIRHWERYHKFLWWRFLDIPIFIGGYFLALDIEFQIELLDALKY